MKKIIHTSKYFKLTAHNAKNPRKRGKGPRYYKITVIDFRSLDMLREIDEYLSGVSGKYFKNVFSAYYYPRVGRVFNDLSSAQRTYTMLLMKWS